MGRDNEVVDWIPSHVQRGLDEEKIVYLYVTVVSLAVLIRRYQCFLAMTEVSNITKRCVPEYGLYRLLVHLGIFNIRL